MRYTALVEPTARECEATLPGDETIPNAPMVFDRAMTLTAPPTAVGAWLLQIGRRTDGRAGWYCPRWLERLLPPKHRALRHIDPTLALRPQQKFHDWMTFGKPIMITAEEVIDGVLILASSRQGRPHQWSLAWVRTSNGSYAPRLRRRSHLRTTTWTWTLVWNETPEGHTRLHMRLRVSRVVHTLMAGEIIDRIACEWFRQALEERFA